ncbi:MAG TPA: hypothetical protein DHV77_06645 [Erysipelotrichaceae bacterium]|nr:hypothetical protein [Erysipelotrichaceae bacterium]
MVVGLLGNESPDSDRFTLVTPKPENGVRLQATLGNQNPTGLPVGAVRSCYKNLVKPLKILKFLWVSSPLHLVSCYIILPLVMTSDKGKNKGKKIW